MSVSITPPMFLQFFVPGTTQPAVGYQLFTYIAGTSTKQATWTDSTQITQSANPIIADANGVMIFWVDPTLSYKYVLAAKGDTDPPTSPIYSVDNIGSILYPRTAAEIAASVMPTNFSYPSGDVRRYGALGNGTTNDQPAFAQALSCNALVYVPPPLTGFYRLSAGITVPTGTSIYGLAFQPSNPPTGTKLVFDLSVTICVTLGGASATNGSATIKGISICRAVGTPPAGSIGLLNQRTGYTIVEDVSIISHQINFECLGDKTVYGAICMVNRLYTGAAYDSHIVIDTMPEVRFNQCRIGMSGPGDQSCNSYVRIQGGSTTNAANGPGTIVFVNTQFNQGVNSATYWFSWQNQTPGNIADVTLFQIDTCYVEDTTIGIFSDATWPAIGRLLISNTMVNVANTAFNFFGINAATQINNWEITGCYITCGITLNPASQINFLNVNDCQFQGLVSVTAPTGSTVNFNNCQWQGGLTLAGSQVGCMYSGELNSGAFTRSGITSGNPLINIRGYNTLSTWVPALAFGGGQTGLVLSVDQADFQINGDIVFCQVALTLTAVGSSVGAAQLTNLPVPDQTSVAGGAGGGVIDYATNMAGLSGAIVAEVSAGLVNLYQYTATGMNTVTNANFTNTTTIRMTFSYVKALTS